MSSTDCVLDERQNSHCLANNTNLQQEVQAAIAANLAKSEFLATMSHEIRTPLNAMLGMLRLTRQTNLTAEQAEYLGLMHDAAGTLLQVVNGILDFSRIEAGQMEIEQIPFSLRACLTDTLNLLTYEAQQKGLNLNCVLSPDLPDALLGDPLRLRQIMLNLLGNAIKFADQGDIVVHVALHAGNQDELSCHFSVKDHGIGIPAEQQATIFSPYRQATAGTARCYGGSGLGLSIAARLVNMMNGSIWLDSTPGAGSTFHFTACFGRQAADAKHASMPKAAPAGLPLKACPGLNILLVEDNATNRRLAQITLEQAGHRVVLAASGAAAQALLQLEQPDLILMDINMPGMDGLQTTTAIRRREATHGGHIPIIALTAHALPHDRERCRQAGMDGYLSKPVDPAALLASMQGLRLPATKNRVRARRGAALDRRTLLLQVNGDRHLLAEIRDLFLRDCGPLMAGLHDALVHGDEMRFANLVHTLRGMFHSLAANAAQQVAGQMEALGIAHEQTGLTYIRLEHEVRLLKIDLLSMLRNRKPATSTSERVSTRHGRQQTRLLRHALQGKAGHTWKGMAGLALWQAGQNFAGPGLNKGARQ